MRTCLALLITGVLLLLAITHGTALSCPSYASIAQPSVADFDPVKYQGLWYQVYSNEPTIPSFCECTTLNWTVTSPTTFVDTFSASCGFPMKLNLSGTLSANASEPSNLKEGFATWAEVPNMIFNVTKKTTSATTAVSSDGSGDFEYTRASVYSCLGMGLFSLQLLSREPLSPQEAQQMLDDVTSAFAGVINTDKMKFYNFSKCATATAAAGVQ